MFRKLLNFHTSQNKIFPQERHPCLSVPRTGKQGWPVVLKTDALHVGEIVRKSQLKPAAVVLEVDRFGTQQVLGVRYFVHVWRSRRKTSTMPLLRGRLDENLLEVRLQIWDQNTDLFVELRCCLQLPCSLSLLSSFPSNNSAPHKIYRCPLNQFQIQLCK